MKINGREIDVSNQDKEFFPKVGLTKGDLINYYGKVAEIMLPHMKNYGVSMQRYPDGVDGEGWYEKDAPDYFPDWIKRVNFPKREGGSFNAPVVDTQSVLVYLADQAMITPHLYLSRIDDLELPDKMIYDLDPPENTQDFSAVRDAALAIHDICEELELKSWVQTTGSKGYHVVIPLMREWGFKKVKDFAEDVALVLVRRHKDKYTLEQRKDKRKGRIYLDTFRNSYGSTAVSPYAVRALPEASIATPVDWNEIRSGANPRDWTIKNIFRRLGQKEDPWADLMHHAQSLDSRQKILEDIMDREGLIIKER